MSGSVPRSSNAGGVDGWLPSHHPAALSALAADNRTPVRSVPGRRIVASTTPTPSRPDAGHRRCRCAKLPVVAVIVIAEMFGISGRRAELGTLLERFGSWAGGEPGCRRYMFAATLTDPSRFVLESEWETQEALDTHYRSEAFAEFQLGLDGLLARPSESIVYSAADSVRPLNTRPMDPRDAD